jgi:hypothetical protein
MAGRITKTPGATEAPKTTETEVVTPTAADQADAALNAILGTPDSKSTSTPSEPVQEAPATKEQQDKQEYEEFLEWKKNRAGAATQPAAQHVPASGVGSEPVAKRTRQVLTDKGWDSEEY